MLRWAPKADHPGEPAIERMTVCSRTIASCDSVVHITTTPPCLTPRLLPRRHSLSASVLAVASRGVRHYCAIRRPVDRAETRRVPGPGALRRTIPSAGPGRCDVPKTIVLADG